MKLFSTHAFVEMLMTELSVITAVLLANVSGTFLPRQGSESKGVHANIRLNNTNTFHDEVSFSDGGMNPQETLWRDNTSHKITFNDNEQFNLIGTLLSNKFNRKQFSGQERHIFFRQLII